ncbi:hypothetical protein ABIA85_005927 [Bradyrhizobium sp. LA6.10]|jgi:hypothetical protein|uniref:hypothetical protein n=1 Tax=Bradyrhizobium sp. LA6.10 TaxID=3156318 RepID=UPI0033937EB9
MEGLWAWFAALSDDKKFDLLKILLEKALLAAVVGIAGAIFAVLLERYKSTLKKQEELSKIMIPEIKSMLDDAEGLFLAGVTAIRAFEQQALSCQAWAKALCQGDARIETEERYKVPEDFNRAIVRCEGKMISPMELLERTAPNDAARKLLLNPMLTISPRETLVGGEFPGLIFTVLNQSPGSRDRPGLALLFARTLFGPLDRDPHDAYNEKANAFALAMMRRLPTETKLQKSVHDALSTHLKFIRELMDGLPGSFLMNVGQLPPYRQLATSHAVIQSKLRNFLKTV